MSEWTFVAWTRFVNHIGGVFRDKVRRAESRTAKVQYMKYIIKYGYYLLVTVFFLSTISNAQTKTGGYANFGMTAMMSNIFDERLAVTACMGITNGNHVGAGIGSDFFVIGKRKSKFIQSYADFRIYTAGLHKPVTPYFAVQPGIIFINKAIVYPPLTDKSKGSFAINLLLGVRFKAGKVGMFISGGYTNFSINQNYGSSTYRTAYSGGRISIGLAF